MVLREFVNPPEKYGEVSFSGGMVTKLKKRSCTGYWNSLRIRGLQESS